MRLLFQPGLRARVSRILARRWGIFYVALLLVAPRAGASFCSRALEVRDTSSAVALAEAIANCTGGDVEVQWRGQVKVENAIRVEDGTILRITGADSATEANGDGANGLFSVRNASLHVHNLRLVNGNATSGGAVEAIGGSTVIFNETSFVGNAATTGGAVFVEDSTASWYGESQFVGNTAWERGGAVFVSLNSHLAWYGRAMFSENVCTSDNDSSGDCRAGAVAVVNNSTALWMVEASFVTNMAESAGGAVYVASESTVEWKAGASYSNNSAVYGGAVFGTSGAHISWHAWASYSENFGFVGGALCLQDGSSVAWSRAANFSTNTAAYFGGAVAVSNRSFALWEGNSSFDGNNAVSERGGAVAVIGNSSIVLAGAATFSANIAGFDGGAVYVGLASTALWEGDSSFNGNIAEYGSGGGVFVENSSDSTWLAPASFSGNSAEGSFGNEPQNLFARGGAVAAVFGARVFWQADSYFFRNHAYAGGAVSVSFSSVADWQGGAHFYGNGAEWGGAVQGSNSSLSWAGEMVCTNNTAQLNGGGVLATLGDVMKFNGRTELTGNYAGAEGGAVGTQVVDNARNSSHLYFNGLTSVTNNSCGLNGGAIALGDALYVHFEAQDTVELANNSAVVSGGAIFVSGMSNGLTIKGVNFISNEAAVGGAVFSTSLGVIVRTESGGIDKENSVDFEECEFVNNQATATGGAVESGAGVHQFRDSSFSGNAAGVGGALRTAGNVLIDNCSFVENSSAAGGGPAMSNIGVITNMSNSYFGHNLFSCEKGEFLEFNFSKSDSLFNAVCDGCGEEQPPGVISSGGRPLCSVEMDHTTSDGGHATVEMLSIEYGWWRPTPTSRQVLPCYNEDACGGGTTGAPGYCNTGYKDEYCSVCIDGYTASMGRTCTKCVDGAGRVVLLVFLAALVLLAFAMLVVYLTSDETQTSIVTFVMRRIPMPTVKIVIVMWQILTQFAAVTGVVYPGIYNDFLSVVDAVNFGLGWIWSTTCVDVDFHGRLVVATVGPIVCVVVLGATYVFAGRRTPRADVTALREMRKKHLSALVWLVFLVYSSASSFVFQTFACDRLDDEELENGRDYLRADYRIDCDSPRHKAFKVYAGFMILVYPVGIPLFFAYLVFPHRDVLTVEETRGDDMRVASSSALWTPYRPGCFFYELVECARRLLLTGVVVFIFPDTAAQIAIGLVIALLFAFVSAIAAPYSSKWDGWVSRAGDAVVIMSLYLALLLKVSVVDERKSSQVVFEGILVAAHVCMVATILVEIVVMAGSLRSGNVAEHAFDREGVTGVELQEVEGRVETIHRQNQGCSSLRQSERQDEHI